MHQHLDHLAILVCTFNVAGCIGISLVVNQELQHVQVLLLTGHHHSIRPSVLAIAIVRQSSVFQQ